MKKFFGALILAVVGIAIVANMSPDKIEDDIHKEVAADSIEEYDLAKKHGDKMDVCLRAGMVAESFLQAHDEVEYQKWRGIERADCKRAGL